MYDARALSQPRPDLRALGDAELIALADTIADARAYGTTDLCALRREPCTENASRRADEAAVEAF